MSDKLLIVKGVLWSGVQLLTNQFFSFLVKLVLAKLLLPSEFGIVGMAMVFTGFVQVINQMGISAMLIQKKAETLRDDHFHTAFWTGIGWSVLLYVIIVAIIRPLAVQFYNEPLLSQILPVLAAPILIAPLNMVNKAKLTKDMNFKKMAMVENSASALSGILALVWAYLGFGVWALVSHSVLTVLFAAFLYLIVSSWRPKFVWSNSAFKDVFGFGAYTTGTSITNYLINNFDYFLIGKLVSASALGAYTFAFVITDTFRGKLMGIINKVMYPMYGKKQDDKSALKNYYLKVVQYNCLLVYPVMLIILISGEDLVFQVFGNKWADAIFPIKALSLSVMVHMLVNSNTILIRGLGKPKLEMTLQIIKASIFIPILSIGIAKYGIDGAAVAVLIHKIIVVFIAQIAFRYKLDLDINYKDFAKAASGPVTAALGSAALVYLVSEYVFYNLYLQISITALFYAGLVFVIMGKELKSALSKIRKSGNK